MAGGGEASVRVPINLEIVNSSLTDIKKVLDSLSPNTKNFGALKAIVADMEKSAAAFAQKMAVPFKTKSQFTSAGKDLDKFMAQMEKFNKLRGGLELGDFNIVDPASLQQIENLKKQLEDAQKEIVKIQEQTLQGLFNNADVSGALVKIDPEITKKSFEEVEEIVNEKVNEINEKIAKIGSDNNKAIDIGNKLKEIVGKNFISSDVLGEDVFNQFFKKNGSFKAGQQNPFVDYLTETFNLTPDQVSKLKNQSAAKINEILNETFKNGNRKFFRSQTMQATAAEKGAADLVNDQQVLAALQQVQTAFNTAGAQSEQYRQALVNLKNTMDNVTQSGQKQGRVALETNYDAMAQAVQSYKVSLESAQGSLMKLNRQQATFNSLKSAITNFMGFTQVLNLVKTGVRDAAAHIKELDTVMNGISIVTDMSTADLWEQVDAYTQLAQKYGTTIKGAYEVSQIYYQQGLKSNEVMALTEETLKLSKISGLDYATTTDYMTTALRGFHMEMEEASRVVDVYSALAANTAVSQQELAEAMTRTASSMEAVGATFEQSSAMIATMVAATRESASNIGSAMKSIASRYGELTKDPTKLLDSEGEEINFNKVDAALKSVGISMQTADHQFRSITEVILELSDAWDTLDSRQQRYIATQMAGNRQQSRFLALVSNGDELRKNLEIAENSEGTGSEQALKYLDSLEAKLNQVQTAWQEFYTTIGIEEAWKGFLDSTTQVLNTLNGLPKAFNKIPIAAIGAIATIINAAKTLGTTALGGLSKMIMPYVLAAGQAAETVAGQEGLKGGQKYNEEFQKALNGLSGGIASKIASIFTVAAGALNTLALTMDTTEPKGRKLAGTLASVSVVLQGISAAISFIKKDYASGIMSLVGAFTSGMTAFGLFNESMEEKLNRLKENSDNLKNTAQQLKSEERSLTTLKKKYDELEEHRYDSEEAAQAFQEVQNEIAEKFPELVSSYDSVGNATIEAADIESRLAAIRISSAEASANAAEAELRYQKVKAESDRLDFQKKNQQIQQEQNQNLRVKYGDQVREAFRQSGNVSLTSAVESETGNRFVSGPNSWTQSFLTDDQWLTQVLGEILVSNASKYKHQYDAQWVRSLFETNDVVSKAQVNGKNVNILAELYKNALAPEDQIPLVNDILAKRDQLSKYNQLTNQLLERSDYETQDYETLYEQWQTEYQNVYLLMSEAERDLGRDILQNIQQAKAGIITYTQLVKTLESTSINNNLLLLTEKKQLDSFKNSNLYNVVSQHLLSHASERDTDQTIQSYVESYEQDIQALNDWLNSLNAYERQQFEERLKDRRHYNTYSKLTQGLELKDTPKLSNGQSLEQFINDYYDEEKVQARVQQNIQAAQEKANKNKYNGVSQSLEKIDTKVINTAAEEQFNNQLINLTETLGKYNPNVDLNLTGVSESFSLLSNELQDKLLDNGLLTTEAIENSMKALEVAGQKDSAIYNFLDETKSKLINNLLLSIQTELDAYTKGADTAISNIKKLQSGVGFEDLSKILTTLNQYLDKTTGQLSIDDFDFVDGNWTIKLDSLEKATTGYTKQMSEFDKDFEEQMQTFSKARELIQQINKGKSVSDISILADANIADIGKYLTWNGTTYEWNDKKHSSEELSKILNDNEKLAIQQNELYKAYKENYKDKLLQLGNDYKRIDKTLTSVISNRNDIQLTDVTKLKNQLHFNNIKEMIDQGFLTWTGDHYEATAEQLQKMLNRSVAESKLTDITQINNFQAQIDKLAQEASAETALANIIASPDKVTEEMLVAWANAWKVNVDIIKEQFIKNADGKTYSIKGNTTDFIKRRGMDATEVAIEYANKLREAVNTVYNGVTSAITSGEQRLNNTAEIRETIVPLQKMGVAKLDESLNKWIITVTDENVQEVINAINASDLSQEQKTKNIDSILKSQQSKTFDTVFSSILKDTKNISRDTMQKLADFYGVSVEALLATDAFEFDANTQAYAVQDKSYLKSILATSKGKINETAYRSLEAQLYTMENELNGQAMSFLSNTNIKETDVADILNKYQESTGKNLLEQLDIEIVSFTDFINMYFTRDANGNLQIQDNEAFRDLAVQFGLSQEQIQNTLIQRISNTISNLSSLSNDIINGFNTPDKMNAVLQELRRSYYKGTTEKGKIIDFDFSDIFEYNDALNKFVYTQTGIALRIRQLKQQLEQADGNKDAIDAQHQLDMFMAELGQSIDIAGYLNLEQGTKEQQKARQELIRNVSNYNAAALEHTGEIAISQDELQKALNGDLVSIQNIYEIINKDVSSNDLVTEFQRPLNTIQTVIDTLSQGGTTIVDQITHDILEDIGALADGGQKVVDGKYQVNITNITDNLVNAYSILYDALAETEQASVQTLNEAAAKIAKSQMSKQQAGLDLMSNAAEMTIDQFVDIFTSLGVTVDKNFLEADKWGKYLTLLGGDNLQIKDLSGLIKEQGLEEAFSTEKGKEALKSYADSMISQGNSIRDRISQLVTDVENAEIGDQINVAGLEVNGTIITGVQTLTETFRNNIWEALIEQYQDYLTDYDIARIRNVNAKAQDTAKYKAAKNITDNWNNVSYEMLEEFAKANNYDMQQVLDSFIQNADGSYQGKGSKIAFAKYTKLDDKYIADLRREANEMADTTISDVIEASIQHLQDGSEQKITVTDENRAILTTLDGQWGELNDKTNEFIINTISKNVDDVIAAIQGTSGISQSQKNQWISQLYKDQQNKTSAAILSNAFNSADNLDYETVAQLTDKFGQNFTNYNRTTGIFSLDLPALSQYLEDLDKLPNLLGIRQEALKNAGLDNDSLRAARAQVASLIQSSSVYTRGNALISGRQNISETMINDFLDVADISEKELMKYMTKEGDHWTMNDRQALAFAKRIGMTQKEIFNTFATNITSSINNLGSNIVSGFSDISEMQRIVDTMDSYWSTDTPTIDALFDYNEVLGKFILSTQGISDYITILRKQLEQAIDDGQKELIDGQIKQLQKQVKDSVNFDIIFDTGRSSKTRENDRNELIRQLANVNAADEKAGKIIKENIENLFIGGEAAVQAAANIYQALGKSFTVEDANKFARMNLSQVDAAREALDSNVGDYITQEAATLGEAAGYFTVSKPDSNGFVQILKKNKDNLENALKQYYHALLANGEQDIDKLNEAIINIWEEQGNKISGQNDLLSKASGMTFREFGEGLAAIGVTLTENMLQEYLDSGLIEQIAGTNQVKVTNFEQFARRIGVTDRTSKQYQDLYSQFIDSQIEDLTYTQESILSSVNDISSAKAGDKINISKAMAQFDQQTQLALEQYFSSYGAQYADGILAINKNTDIFGITNALLQATDNVTNAVNSEKIESAMVELQDAIQDAIKGFVDAITSGIKGGITNSGRSDLINFSDKYLGGILKNEDFIQASDGLKLTTDAAIKLYNVLKNIKNVDISGVFDALSESILKRDNIQTMDGILANIQSLQAQINALEEAGTAAAQAKIGVLKQELALYNEIAMAGMSNPDNYDFMNKKLPDSMQGPLNYWQSTAQMLQTMTSSAKSGYMSVVDFYNMANEIENIAKLSGEKLSFMGMEIGEGAYSAADIIRAGMGHLSSSASHAGEVDLSGLADFGLNLSMSAEDMAAGVEKGIDAAADANIEMLDGLIAVLETIVAMKGLEDITGDDNTIDLKDIFPTLTYDGAENAAGVQKVSGTYQEWAQKLKDNFEKNDKLAEQFENIKLGTENLRNIVSSIADKGEIDLETLGITAGQFTDVMEAFRQLNASGGFDSLDDTAAMMKTLAKTGAEITVNMGKQKVTLTKGKVLIATKNEKGEYEYSYIDENGQEHKTQNVNEAIEGQINADIANDLKRFNEGAGNKKIITPVENKKRTYTINLENGISAEMTVDEKTSNYVVNGKQYSSPELAALSVAQTYAREHADDFDGVSGMKFGDMQSWQLALRFNITPMVEISSIDDIKNNSEVLGRILRSGKTANEILGMTSDQLKFAFGIDLDKENIREADLQGFLEEQKKQLIITPEVAPINADDIKVEGAIHVFAVIDGFVDSDNIINLRSGTGYKKVLPGQNLRKALDKDSEEWENFYRQNSWVRERYAPNGESYEGPTGRAEGKKLWELSQKGDANLSDIQQLAVKSYEKMFVKPVKDFLASDNYTKSVSEAEKQVEESREQWKQAHNGSDIGYDYTQNQWYKELMDKQEGTSKSLMEQYREALEASNEWTSQYTKMIQDSMNPDGSIDLEQYYSYLASAAKAWKAQNEKNDKDDQNDIASPLEQAAGILKQAAQALLGAANSLKNSIISDKIQEWITKGILSKDFGEKLLKEMSSTMAETPPPSEQTPSTTTETPPPSEQNGNKPSAPEETEQAARQRQIEIEQDEKYQYKQQAQQFLKSQLHGKTLDELSSNELYKIVDTLSSKANETENENRDFTNSIKNLQISIEELARKKQDEEEAAAAAAIRKQKEEEFNNLLQQVQNEAAIVTAKSEEIKALQAQLNTAVETAKGDINKISSDAIIDIKSQLTKAESEMNAALSNAKTTADEIATKAAELGTKKAEGAANIAQEAAEQAEAYANEVFTVAANLNNLASKQLIDQMIRDEREAFKANHPGQNYSQTPQEREQYIQSLLNSNNLDLQQALKALNIETVDQFEGAFGELLTTLTQDVKQAQTTVQEDIPTKTPEQWLNEYVQEVLSSESWTMEDALYGVKDSLISEFNNRDFEQEYLNSLIEDYVIAPLEKARAEQEEAGQKKTLEDDQKRKLEDSVSTVKENISTETPEQWLSDYTQLILSSKEPWTMEDALYGVEDALISEFSNTDFNQEQLNSLIEQYVRAPLEKALAAAQENMSTETPEQWLSDYVQEVLSDSWTMEDALYGVEDALVSYFDNIDFSQEQLNSLIEQYVKTPLEEAQAKQEAERQKAIDAANTRKEEAQWKRLGEPVESTVEVKTGDSIETLKSEIDEVGQEPIVLSTEADTSGALSGVDAIRHQTGTITYYGNYVGPRFSSQNIVNAKGNVALATGTRTLMGELGPELVVSNGQYFVVGQNGAEFVDLDKDAIVFNHLQTQRLLTNGSSGRGTPFTNAHNATSMATGNVHGPAKASAEAVLGQLYALRAMWQSLKDASLSDLAKKGGGGGGGGDKQIPGFIRDVERWYNWLQKIADLEKQITYQEQLRSKIESDMVSSGNAYYKSQKKSYEQMRDSALTSESLYLSQKDYFEKRREELNSKNSPLSSIYTFDETGQPHFASEEVRDWLTDIFTKDDFGRQKYTPKQQYQMIIARNKQFANFMQYDESGKEINKKDFKSDDEYYLAMVKAFSERMDAEQDEMQELFDSWNEQEKAVLEQMQAMNEQLQAMKDNQKEVEESVLKAIEESRQRQIDELKDTKEALQKTNEEFIDGLSKSLDKERQMYENNEKDQELERNRRQLAILQRSGASASQIASLQEKIQQQSQDQYFEKQQEQIDAVKEASDLQIERLDHQIELAEEQLEYEKSNGLLWGQVYDVMSQSPQQIADFISSNTEDFWSKSPLSTTQDVNDLVFKAEQWVGFRDDVEMQKAAMGRIDQNLDIFMGAMEQIYGKDANWDAIRKESEEKYQEYFMPDNEDPGTTAWDAYYKASELATPEPIKETEAPAPSTGGGNGQNKNIKVTSKSTEWYSDETYHWKRKYFSDGTWTIDEKGKHNRNTGTEGKNGYYEIKCSVCGRVMESGTKNGNVVDEKSNQHPTDVVEEKSNQHPTVTEKTVAEQIFNNLGNAVGDGIKQIISYVRGYSSGGQAGFTGLAMLHGTSNSPEGILNAEDYKAWKQDIKTTNLLYNALADVSATQHSSAAMIASTSNTNNGISIENAVVNMNATIANDYDARRAGEQALEQMLTIARKSGTRSAQRR